MRFIPEYIHQSIAVQLFTRILIYFFEAREFFPMIQKLHLDKKRCAT